MNLTRAFAATASLAVLALILAIAAVGSVLRLADADIVGNTQTSLTAAARRIESAYATQIAALRADVSVPLSRTALDNYGRRIVAATIGDNEGIDGGLYIDRLGVIADAPQPVVNARERAAIESLAHTVSVGKSVGTTTVRLRQGDTVAIAAVPLADGRGVAWARERIAATALRGQQAALPLVWSAVSACVLVVAASAWIIFVIRRDARAVLTTIAALEADPAALPALPEGDFGKIAAAIIAMAQRRAAAEALARRSERLAAIGRLAANAAHEIRNPLNALRLQVDLLRRKVGPELNEPAAKLGTEVERLDAVVVGMLEIGADRPVATSEVDLREIVQRAIDILEPDASRRSRRLVCICDTVQTQLHGDAGRLVQLALNLLANALDAAPEGTAVEIRIHAGPVLTVTDTGDGIAPTALPHIFEPFFSTKPNGTGLGLAIAHEIALAHGARIDVRSRPSLTSFIVTFGDA